MSLMDVFVKIGADTSGLEEGISKSKGLASGLGSGIKSAMSIAGAAIGTATAAVGAFAASSVNVGMTFDSSMSQVAATMGKTTDEITELRDFAMEMGAKTAFSATQAAEALNYMALAGYDADQSMQMLPNVLNLAAAGSMELATASDMVTDAQSALGLSMEETTQLVDMMAKTSSKSNTSVQQLGDAILTIGGTAKTLAGGTTELNAALGILADNGIKGAEGGTKLRNVILSLSAPTDNAAAKLEELGVSTVDAQGNVKSLDDIMGDLNKSLEGMGTAEKADVISTIFNKQDIAAVNALLDTSQDRWDELTDAIEDSKDAAENMAKTQLDNLAGDVTLFKSALEGAQLLIAGGLTPDLRQFVQFGTNGLSKISDAFKEGGMSGAMKAFGEVLSEGLNMIIEKIPEFLNAGMTLLGAVGQGIIDNLPQIVEAAVQVVVMLVQGLVQAIPALTQGTITLLSSLKDSLIANAGTLLESGRQLISFIWDGISNGLPQMISSGADILNNLAIGFTNSIPQMILIASEMVTQVLDLLLSNLPQFLSAGVDFIMNIYDGFTNNLPQIIDAAVQMMGSIISTIVENLPQILEQGITIVGKIVAGLIQAIPKIIAAIPQLIAAIVTTFAGYDWASIGLNILEGIKNGIMNAVGAVVEAAKQAAQNIWDAITGFFDINSPSRKMEWAGKMIDEGFAKGIEGNTDAVSKAMNELETLPDVRADGVRNNNQNNNIVINVYGAKGQDEEVLAGYVADALRDEVVSLGAV